MSGNVAPVIFLIALITSLMFGAYNAGKSNGYRDGTFGGYFRGYLCGYEKGRSDTIQERDAE